MRLSEQRPRHLKGLAHSRKPNLTAGQQGLRDSVLQAIEMALTAHELTKICIQATVSQAHGLLVDHMVAGTHVAVIQRFGHVAILFRLNPKRPRAFSPSDL